MGDRAAGRAPFLFRSARKQGRKGPVPRSPSSAAAWQRQARSSSPAPLRAHRLAGSSLAPARATAQTGGDEETRQQQSPTRRSAQQATGSIQHCLLTTESPWVRILRSLPRKAGRDGDLPAAIRQPSPSCTPGPCGPPPCAGAPFPRRLPYRVIPGETGRPALGRGGPYDHQAGAGVRLADFRIAGLLAGRGRGAAGGEAAGLRAGGRGRGGWRDGGERGL
jgi:hypothetical protein